MVRHVCPVRGQIFLFCAALQRVRRYFENFDVLIYYPLGILLGCYAVRTLGSRVTRRKELFHFCHGNVSYNMFPTYEVLPTSSL